MHVYKITIYKGSSFPTLNNFYNKITFHRPLIFYGVQFGHQFYHHAKFHKNPRRAEVGFSPLNVSSRYVGHNNIPTKTFTLLLPLLSTEIEIEN